VSLGDDLLAVLNDPTHMWTHALKELHSDGQRLFLTLATLPERTAVEDLRNAYTRQHFTPKQPFADTLRTLEDSFITISAPYPGLPNRRVAFRNPSLADFAHQYLDENVDWLTRILRHPVFFEQPAIIFSLGRAKGTSEAMAKYPGILAWVTSQRLYLLESMLRLFDSEEPEADGPAYSRVRQTRLGQIVTSMQLYGLAHNTQLHGEMRSIVEAQLEQDNMSTADDLIQMLKRPGDKAILDKVLRRDAAFALREKLIVSSRTGRFTRLHAVEALLRNEETHFVDEWRDEAVEYYRGWAAQLEGSDDLAEFDRAINEIDSISDYLGEDFSELMEDLEAWREDIPRDSEDYEGDIENTVGGSNVATWDEVDRLFGGLIA
jgi:hypothetical protein